MAFWGAPDDQPDHAERASRAARAIAIAIEADNQTRLAAGDPPVRVRIGLHSGPVTVGNIGAPGRINYTIIGDTVNIAQRLEQLGKADAAETRHRRGYGIAQRGYGRTPGTGIQHAMRLAATVCAVATR